MAPLIVSNMDPVAAMWLPFDPREEQLYRNLLKKRWVLAEPGALLFASIPTGRQDNLRKLFDDDGYRWIRTEYHNGVWENIDASDLNAR